MMLWQAFWLNAAIFALAIAILYRVFVAALRKKACYRLYAVRDDLVYLVASGRMDENDPVFEHYYTRVNRLLADAPDIGIDDILHNVFIRWRGQNEFPSMLTAAR